MIELLENHSMEPLPRRLKFGSLRTSRSTLDCGWSTFRILVLTVWFDEDLRTLPFSIILVDTNNKIRCVKLYYTIDLHLLIVLVFK